MWGVSVCGQNTAAKCGRQSRRSSGSGRRGGGARADGRLPSDATVGDQKRRDAGEEEAERVSRYAVDRRSHFTVGRPCEIQKYALARRTPRGAAGGDVRRPTQIPEKRRDLGRGSVGVRKRTGKEVNTGNETKG